MAHDVWAIGDLEDDDMFDLGDLEGDATGDQTADTGGPSVAPGDPDFEPYGGEQHDAGNAEQGGQLVLPGGGGGGPLTGGASSGQDSGGEPSKDTNPADANGGVTPAPPPPIPAPPTPHGLGGGASGGLSTAAKVAIGVGAAIATIGLGAFAWHHGKKKHWRKAA